MNEFIDALIQSRKVSQSRRSCFVNIYNKCTFTVSGIVFRIVIVVVVLF